MDLGNPPLDLESRNFQSTEKKSASGQKLQHNVSKFIQNALAIDSPTSVCSRDEETSSKKRASTSGRSSNFVSRKKKKVGLGSHSWNKLLSEVKWPGLEEDGITSARSDIDSYSDNEVTQSDSVYIATDSDGGTDGQEEQRGGMTRWRHTMDLLHTSTPQQQRDTYAHKETADCINDFESDHSSIYATPSPTHTPHNSGFHTSTHHISHPHTPTRHISPHNSTSHTADDEISTPPSSPEEGGMLSRTKTSDWLKTVPQDGSTTSVTETDYNSSKSVIKTSIDSAKKGSSRRGRHHYVEDGLAERLERVVQREEMEVSFWEQKVKSLQDREVDESSCLTVRITALENCYSLFVASCHLMRGNPLRQSASTLTESAPPGIPPTEISVLFSQRCAKSVNLRVGSRVRIYPPWQCLNLPHISHTIILCTLFCQNLGHSVTTPTSPHTTSLSSHTTLPPSSSSISPVKSGPPNMNEMNVPLIRTDTTQSVESDQEEFPSLLLDAIECAQYGVVSGVTCRVVRVYRRKRLKIMKTVDKDNTQMSSLTPKALLYGPHTGGSNVTWYLLVCDAAGVYAEIQLPLQLDGKWSECVTCSKNKALYFRDLKLIKRLRSSSSPELISLISSFKLHPPLLPSDSSTQINFLESPPSFYYVFQASVTSPPIAVPEAVEDRLPSVSRVPHSTRLDIFGKVLHYSPEHSKGVDSSPLQALHSSTCGAYLHVVTPTHLTPPFSPSPSTPPLPTTSRATAVLLYLKPSFSTEGLDEILFTSGAVVLLRDVCLESHSNISYTMDTCSLLVPLTTSKRPNFLSSASSLSRLVETECDRKSNWDFYAQCVYPPVSFLKEDLSCLRSLMPPPLPLLHSENARPHSLVALNGKVVAVDEDNAYSWPVCDLCGNEQLSDNVSVLHCNDCDRNVISPNIHVHLAVFLKCKDCQNARVHVTLLQSTIKRMLPLSSSNIENGFDLHRVLGMWVELSSCCIQKVICNADGTVLLRLTEVGIYFET